MARSRKTAEATQITADSAEAGGEGMGRPMPSRDATDASQEQQRRNGIGQAIAEPRQSARGEGAGEPAYPADPREQKRASLSEIPGGPEMQLLRSHKFKQMQIRFQNGQPDERHLEMLKQAGWRDRTEEEGVWTKQIDPNARWQSVAKMEQEFKAVANAIRESKGLAPVLEGLGA